MNFFNDRLVTIPDCMVAVTVKSYLLLQEIKAFKGFSGILIFNLICDIYEKMIHA